MDTFSAAERNKTLEPGQKLNLSFLSLRKWEENNTLFIRCTQIRRTGILRQQQQHSLNEVGVDPGARSRGRASLSPLTVYRGASLRGDRVEQGHGDSLSGLLESCYQVPDVTERPFLHAGSGLKDEDRFLQYCIIT